MSAERIEDRVKKLLVERLLLKQPPESIPEETNLMEALALDSVKLFEVVIGLEDAFGISFADDEFSMEKFSTVKSIAEVVRNKTEAAG